MPISEQADAAEESASTELKRQHIAGLLALVEREAHVSQRKLAAELGLALGLVNTYVRRCVKKGLIKVKQVPSRRYAYYLTPQGFAEKSRLTAEFLSWSLAFFRRARTDCALLMGEAEALSWKSVALFGGSDLAEIAILSAAEQGVMVVGLVDAGMSRTNVMGVPVFSSIEEMTPRPDGWIITAIDGAQGSYDALAARMGADRVLAPALLSVRRVSGEAAQ